MISLVVEELGLDPKLDIKKSILDFEHLRFGIVYNFEISPDYFQHF